MHDDAWKILEGHYRDHAPRLLAMLRRRLDPALARRVDAVGLLNETFMMARRRWDDSSRRRMSPFAWLYRLALDCLIEAWRFENRERRSPDREVCWPDRSSGQVALHLAGSLTSPSEALERKELGEEIREALGQLKAIDRRILEMRIVDELSFLEVAELLGVTREAAAKRYARALRRLKDLWQSGRVPGEVES